MKRSEKVINLSKSVPYSKEELTLLYKIVDNKITTPEGLFDEDFSEIALCISDTLSNGGYPIDRESDSEENAHFERLNMMQFLLVYFKRICLFLILVPFRNVPLYINDSQLGAFARWRLLINK